MRDPERGKRTGAEFGRPPTFADRNNEFALALCARLLVRPGNLFVSPFSIRMALGMVLAGAKGETAAQIANVLRLSLSEDGNAAELSAMSSKMDGAGDGEPGTTANSLWAQGARRFVLSSLI